LRKAGLGVQVHYIPVYKQPFYQRLGYLNMECPNAENFYREAVSIPIYPGLKDRDIHEVIRVINKILSK